MTKPDQKKVRLLIGLLIVLALTLFFGYRMNRTPNPAVVQAEDQKTVATPPAQTDARIRLDLLKRENPDEDLGKKNLFQYGPPPAPPAAAANAAGKSKTPGMSANAPQPGTTTAAPATSVPAGPPPPPPIPLKYIGVSSVEPDSKTFIATLIDDNQHHFNAVNGDIFMGRYKISRITENSVDVDDLQYNRHQTLPLVKQ